MLSAASAGSVDVDVEEVVEPVPTRSSVIVSRIFLVKDTLFLAREQRPTLKKVFDSCQSLVDHLGVTASKLAIARTHYCAGPECRCGVPDERKTMKRSLGAGHGGLFLDTISTYSNVSSASRYSSMYSASTSEEEEN